MLPLPVSSSDSPLIFSPPAISSSLPPPHSSFLPYHRIDGEAPPPSTEVDELRKRLAELESRLVESGGHQEDGRGFRKRNSSQEPSVFRASPAHSVSTPSLGQSNSPLSSSVNEPSTQSPADQAPRQAPSKSNLHLTSNAENAASMLENFAIYGQRTFSSQGDANRVTLPRLDALSAYAPKLNFSQMKEDQPNPYWSDPANLSRRMDLIRLTKELMPEEAVLNELLRVYFLRGSSNCGGGINRVVSHM